MMIKNGQMLIYATNKKYAVDKLKVIKPKAFDIRAKKSKNLDLGLYIVDYKIGVKL